MGRSTVPVWRSSVGYHLGASGGTAEMAREVVRLAVASEAQGGSSSAFVSEIIEDWCGTPWPRKWPWPGARPDTEAEGPSPEPWGVQTARVIGAVIFASAASRLSSGDLRTAFADGADGWSRLHSRTDLPTPWRPPGPFWQGP